VIAARPALKMSASELRLSALLRAFDAEEPAPLHEHSVHGKYDVAQEIDDIGRGHRVYFVREWGAKKFLKIGMTSQAVWQRLALMQSGNPRPLIEIGSIPGGRVSEVAIHRALEASRVQREWFRLDSFTGAAITAILKTSPKTNRNPHRSLEALAWVLDRLPARDAAELPLVVEPLHPNA